MKRIIGCLYGIFLEKPLNKLYDFTKKKIKQIESDYLGFCMRGCENCYKWQCAVREKDSTPYKKFRKPPFPKE